jgi:hypothetical protein
VPVRFSIPPRALKDRGKGSEVSPVWAAPFYIEIHDGYIYPPKSGERNAAEPAAESWLGRRKSEPGAASGFDWHSLAMEARAGEELTGRAVQ